MKKLIHKVDLVFFEDDATGEFGLAHKETYDDNEGFNAFWNGIGIFHDVFEHWFEKRHKYFQNEAAMNVGGEMAAMGAMWYYYDYLGVRNRQSNPNSIYNFSESMRRTTQDMIEESIQEGYSRFGYVLECKVPEQRESENGELEYQIDVYSDEVKNYEFKHDKYKAEPEKECSEAMKNSITKNKIANLHRWGYRMAEKLIPDNYDNRDTLINFIEFFDTFCLNNKAKELHSYYSGMTIKLYKDENDIISWKAVLTSSDSQIKNLTIRGTHDHMEEIIFN